MGRGQPQPARAERAAGVYRFVDDGESAGGRRGFGRTDSHGVDVIEPAAAVQLQMPGADADDDRIGQRHTKHLLSAHSISYGRYVAFMSYDRYGVVI